MWKLHIIITYYILQLHITYYFWSNFVVAARKRFFKNIKSYVLNENAFSLQFFL